MIANHMPASKIISLVLLIFALNLLAVNAAWAQPQNLKPAESQLNIQLELDSSGAHALIDLFGRKQVSDEELEKVLNLPSTLAMIRQAGRFNPTATEENFKSSLRTVIDTGTVEPDPFRLAVVKARLESVSSLLKEVERNKAGFVNDVIGRMRAYAPGNVALKATVHFILGGTSDGFAPAANAYYIALHYYGDDVEGLKLLMAHELFHNVQAAVRNARVGGGLRLDAPLSVTNSVALLDSTVNEGTASMVGDALALPGGKQYSDFLKAKYKRNLDRIKGNFALFELLLYRAYNDPQADFSQLNNIGFSGTWDSPLYFVGYRMGKIIEKYKGKDAIKGLVGADPLQFFNLYMEIYRSQSDPEIVKFSPACEEILQKLQRARVR